MKQCRLFIHGWLGSPKDWRGIARDHDLLFCIPGHDAKPLCSSNNWFPESIEELFENTKDYDQIDFIGYSLGGRIALSFAESFPEKVKTLQLIASHPGYQDPVEIQKQLKQETHIETLFKELSYSSFLEQWYHFDLFKTLNDTHRQRLIQKRLQQNSEHMFAAFKGFSHQYYSSKIETLKKLAHKTNLIVGQQDSKYFQIAHNIQKKIPKLSVQSLATAGNACHISHRLTVKKEIDSFIDQQAS